jgi:hypothetical protein
MTDKVGRRPSHSELELLITLHKNRINLFAGVELSCIGLSLRNRLDPL